MKIGFTGSREGLTDRQKTALREILSRSKESDSDEFHHGDCIGADEEAYLIAEELDYRIICHPPTNPRLRAFCASYEERPPKQYLKRNEDIVEEADIVVACPRQKVEVLRSGTWATIRRARKAGKLEIIFP
jgi:hypothetical protein